MDRELLKDRLSGDQQTARKRVLARVKLEISESKKELLFTLDMFNV